MLDEDVKTFLTQVDFTYYDKIIAVAKGAFPLLTKLINATNLPYDIVRCVSYNNTEQLEELHTYFANLASWSKKGKTLIIDDVADTGRTLKTLTDKILKNQDGGTVECLTLCYKPQSIVLPHLYIHEVPNDVWVEFPWE